jgi:hypothetical protein
MKKLSNIYIQDLRTVYSYKTRFDLKKSTLMSSQVVKYLPLFLVTFPLHGNGE